ncbi:hypothetical protein BC629DRAFT_1074309 [Irpex lacteus]|nr:hypothetical protein BC629DRAFT_1074309 [Irpex lacteus]
MSSNQFFTLANWDGSLNQPASSASSSSSAHRQAVNLNQGAQRTTEEQRVAEEELRRQSALAMPPPPVPQTPVRGGGSQWTAHASSYDPVRRNSWSAMSISSESSFSNTDEERRRVEGMLLTSDDLMASSPPKLEHHWQVPATVLTPEMADESNAWNPETHKSPSSSVSWLQAIPPALLDEHGQLTLMDAISSLPPPVGPAMNPTSQDSSFSKRKSSSEPEGFQNTTTSDEEARRSVPPALSFSPSHYPTSELPALLGEDMTLDSQSNQHDSISATLSEHKSSHPESNPIAPPTPTSLLDSFNDAFNTSPRRLSPEASITFAHSPNADPQPNTSSFSPPDFWMGLDKEAFVALAMGCVPQPSGGAEGGSDSSAGTTVARPDLQVHASVQDGQSIKVCFI